MLNFLLFPPPQDLSRGSYTETASRTGNFLSERMGWLLGNPKAAVSAPAHEVYAPDWDLQPGEQDAVTQHQTQITGAEITEGMNSLE